MRQLERNYICSFAAMITDHFEHEKWLFKMYSFMISKNSNVKHIHTVLYVKKNRKKKVARKKSDDQNSYHKMCKNSYMFFCILFSLHFCCNFLQHCTHWLNYKQVLTLYIFFDNLNCEKILLLILYVTNVLILHVPVLTLVTGNHI